MADGVLPPDTTRDLRPMGTSPAVDRALLELSLGRDVDGDAFVGAHGRTVVTAASACQHVTLASPSSTQVRRPNAPRSIAPRIPGTGVGVGQYCHCIAEPPLLV